MPFTLDAQLDGNDPLQNVISEAQKDELTKIGVLNKDGLPDWQIQVTYHWKQKFPAKSVVRVTHKYAPFVAEGTAGGYEHSQFGGDGHIERFCADKAVIKKLDALASQKHLQNVYGMLSGTMVDYVLLTANTWKDGVRDFTLRIHKGHPNEVVTLCFPGAFRSVDSNTLESHLLNFSPQRNLSIYFANIGKSTGIGGKYGEVPRIADVGQ
jgi:hypothetical protein